MPPLPVQSSALVSLVHPWPLHEFLPLQEETAVLQLLVPLQELAPKHFTVVWAEATEMRLPAANKAAAEAANRRRRFILESPILHVRPPSCLRTPRSGSQGLATARDRPIKAA